MAILPISDYPAPASDKSQAQVLSERKGELHQRLQTVQQSGLPQQEKENLSASIRDQIRATDQQRQSKLREAAHKERQQAATARKAQETQASRRKSDKSQSQDSRRLDTQA
ncbi:hypothetical protein [Ethanoligenens sp.]|uniref:hypothetical protein n=1 Tax=Ethanoligenens sp. TaxID=2099655 RepID=UPI0039E9DC44